MPRIMKSDAEVVSEYLNILVAAGVNVPAEVLNAIARLLNKHPMSGAL